MTQILVSVTHSLVKTSSPASIMLVGSLLIGLALGLRRVRGTFRAGDSSEQN